MSTSQWAVAVSVGGKVTVDLVRDLLYVFNQWSKKGRCECIMAFCL